MKGQIRIEFIFGIIVFVLVIVMVVTQTNTLYSSLLGDSRKDALKAKAINVINILAEDPGNPPNWDEIAQSNPNGVKRVGLAFNQFGQSQSYNLSITKILNLSYNCSSNPYGNLFWNFNLDTYRLKVFNSTQQILFCGYDSLEPPLVMETRYVYINGDFGKMTLELW